MGTTSEWSQSRNPTNPLRGTALFIGRRQQLDIIEQGLRQVHEGRPEIVLIQGEPGIGKTRLLKEVRSIALHANMQVCFGRCYEDVALPYLPFVDSLLGQVEQASQDLQLTLRPDIEILHHLLGRGAAPSTTLPSFASQLDQNRLRLFLALTRITIKLAQHRPMLLLLDDLHWADAPSLDLFAHLVFAIGDTALREAVSLAIVGTHRPVDPQSRLGRVLLRLQQEQCGQRLELPGLNRSEVDALIRSLGVARPSHTLVTMISEATQGNPLFVQEVLHHLAQQGGLYDRGGYVATQASAPDLHIPEHLTAALETRVQTLSENCIKVLVLGSFLGERFSFATLLAVSRLTEEELLDLLEEGVRQRFLLNEGHTFQFLHPLMRHVFYRREPITLRRQRLHLQIADTLERLHPPPHDHDVLQIAHHLLLAGPSAAAERLVVYVRRAGDHAFSVFAWAEAARFYEAALESTESTTLLSEQERADLHYLAGLSYYRNMEVSPSLEHHEKAVAAYQRSSDLGGVARALLEKTRVARTLAAVPYGTLADLQPLEEILQPLGHTESELCGRIWAQMAQVYWHARQTEKAEEMALKALAIGRAVGNDRLRAEASFGLGLAQIQQLRLHDALESWQETHEAAQRIDDLLIQGWAQSRMSWTLICLGRLQEAESVAQQACQLIERTHEWSNYALALANLAVVAVVKGDFAEAERRAQDAMVMVYRSRYPWGGLIAMLALASAQFYRGAWTEAQDTLIKMLTPGHLFADPGSALEFIVGVPHQLVQAHATATREVISPMPEETSPDIFFLVGFCALVELGDLGNYPHLAQAAYPMLTLAAERGGLLTSGWGGLIPRALGVIAALNRQWDTAETHFQAAIAVAEKIGAKPELGRSYLDYARMIVNRNALQDHPRALALAQQACAHFTKLGMAPFLSQATQLIQMLQSSQERSEQALPSNRTLINEELVTDTSAEAEQEPVGLARSGPNTFHREGEYWTIRYADRMVRLKDTAGLRFLAILLQAPHQPLHVLKLVALAEGSVSGEEAAGLEGLNTQHDLGDGGELLDRQALQEYKQRLRDVQEELEEARKFHDRGRVEKLEEENAFLMQELRSTFGLGGRSRRSATAAERARVNVTRAIKTAITRLSQQHPALGQHLAHTVKTGISCSYTPEFHFPSPWTQ